MNRQAEIVLKNFILSSNQIIVDNQSHLVLQGLCLYCAGFEKKGRQQLEDYFYNYH